ncbi:MAG: glutamate racemase [Patescibacteria group bacterium]|jgi:glutamate racemase
MIGVFDSGIGGFTVVKQLMRELPDFGIVYFGDTARYPYGDKSAETVTRYAIENTHFLLEHGATVIVIGCNTASSIAVDALKKEFPAVPIFDVITPVIHAAAATSQNKKIGVIGTRTTIGSGIYERLLKQEDKKLFVQTKATPLLVSLVEEGWAGKPETKQIVKKYLLPFQQEQVDTMILGCTHYPLLHDVIQQKAGKRVQLVDPAVETARVVAEHFKAHPEHAQKCKGASRFFLSDITPHAKETAARFLGQKVNFEEASSERV